MTHDTPDRLFDVDVVRCLQCGSPLPERRRRGKVYCDHHCVTVAYEQRNIRGRGFTPIPRRRIPGTTQYEVHCLECPTTFIHDVTIGRVPRFCGEACRLRRQRRADLRQYGITLEHYEALWAEQDGRCAICEGPMLVGVSKRNACIDHCHTTGEVRGLLCPQCNVGLGMFGDDADRLRRASEYLKEDR